MNEVGSFTGNTNSTDGMGAVKATARKGKSPSKAAGRSARK
jgi:hypothetical protein